MVWQVNEHDENQLVLLFELALAGSPQRVRRGDDEIVILSINEYERLGGKKPGFIDHQTSIHTSEDLDLARDRVAIRDVDVDD